MQLLSTLQNDPINIVLILISFLLLIPALVLHELAHGWVAYKLGDTTAARAGRLTLNPLSHIDPLGTIVMPLLLFVFSNGTFSFGYAKPVPINPTNFKDRKKGILLTGIAGPAANIALALVAGILCRLVGLVEAFTGTSLALGMVHYVLYTFTYINLMFAFFNLIPIPPLDGSRVLQYFLKGKAGYYYYRLERFGFYIVIALIAIPAFLGLASPLDYYFSYTVVPLVRLLTG
ncbi:MAG: site-2 protease family protein [Coriobacteriia bacterium]|nr:site-2 protease family protein [Coriobacteriia bacterium]